MQIREYQDGQRRCVLWMLPDSGWNDVAECIDRFLAQAIKAIIEEYAEEPVEWLEINRWPDTGRLLVFPSKVGPFFGNRDERIYFELSSNHLENQYRQIWDSLPDEQQDAATNELDEKIWGRIGECFRHGAASQQLSDGRKTHRFLLAAFDYNPGEDLFYLSGLDLEASARLQEELTSFRNEFGIDI